MTAPVHVHNAAFDAYATATPLGELQSFAKSFPAAIDKAWDMAIEEAAKICRDNEVGASPKDGYVISPRNELSGGSHPGFVYATAIRTLATSTMEE